VPRPYHTDHVQARERAKHAAGFRYRPKVYIAQLRRKLADLTDDDKRALAALLADALNAATTGDTGDEAA
jgi:hypothetical protein